jgi:RimJ/RimL family protein N-acetyltransferase
MKVPHEVHGLKVTLVPYRREHVQKYHEWMSDPMMQQLTRSEPLSLEEEYEMQQTWWRDEDKLTLIVLRSSAESHEGNASQAVAKEQDCIHNLDNTQNRLEEAMVGDINLFFGEGEDRPHPEIDIMVGNPAVRRQGLATEAVALMMQYAVQHKQVQSFTAKIIETNTPSILLFEKLGYKLSKRVEVFEELHYVFEASSSNMEVIKSFAPAYKCVSIDES